MPQRIQELLSALCADGGRLRHQHTRNMVRRLLQYVGLAARQGRADGAPCPGCALQRNDADAEVAAVDLNSKVWS